MEANLKFADLASYIKSFDNEIEIEINLNDIEHYIHDKAISIKNYDGPSKKIIFSKINQPGNNTRIEKIELLNCKNLDLEIKKNSVLPELFIKYCYGITILVKNSTIGTSGVHGLCSFNPTEQQEENITAFTIIHSCINGPIRFSETKFNTFKIDQCQFTLNPDEHGLQNIDTNIYLKEVSMNKFEVDSIRESASCFRLEDSKFNKVLLHPNKGSIHLDKLEIQNTEITLLSMKKPEEDDIVSLHSLLVDNNSTIKAIEIINAKVSSLAIQKSNIQVFDFINTKEIISAYPICNINFTSVTINRLLISKAPSIDRLFFADIQIIEGRIEECQIKKVEFQKSLLVNSSLYIYNCTCGGLKFLDFFNFGKLSFKSFTPLNNTEKQTLHIEASDLGKAQFINCNLGGKSWKYYFASSNILGLFLVNNNFPEEGISDEDLKGNNNRELFSQLYKVFENNGNRPRALLYKKKSLESYRKELKDKKEKNLRQKFDQASLWVNQLSNEFNFSVWRALWVLFIISIVFFFFYCLSIGYTFSLQWNDPVIWKRFFNLAAHWFEFISPIRDTNFIHPIEGDKAITVHAGTRFIDGFSRVIISYMIYQFIQAFRKFGKE